METLFNLIWETWAVAKQMAPYLLFGFLAAGLLSAFVSPAWLERHLGGSGFRPVLKSVLFGIPLPLCSCSVIAVTASLRKHGASRAAATGFLIATPQTGVDSILATWGMLGPVLGMFRPFMALVSGLFGGMLVNLLGGPETTLEKVSETACTDGCCGPKPVSQRGLVAKLAHVLRYGFVTLPKDIAKPLFWGIIAAGLISALVPANALALYIGGGILSMLAMIALGIPIYVCATASIPLAVGFIHMGASPGAALAFLISGPATNAATVATIWKTMGRRTAVLYVGSVALSALFAGIVYDAMAGKMEALGWNTGLHQHMDSVAESGNSFFVFPLLLILAYSCWEPRILTFFSRLWPKNNTPESLVLGIKGMTCEHCASKVREALEAIAGRGQVVVNVALGQATIKGKNLDEESLRKAVSALGYDASVKT